MAAIGGVLSTFFFLMPLCLPWVTWIVWSAIVTSRQHCMLRVMALAADRGLPLEAGIAAFAQTYSGTFRNKALALARLLRDGVPLGSALRKVPGLLSVQAQIVIEMGSHSGNIREATAKAAERDRLRVQDVSQAVSRIAYIAVTAAVSQGLLFFMLYWIVPKLRKIFADFDIELPRLTVTMIYWSEVMLESGFVVIVYLLAMIIVFLPVLLVAGKFVGYSLPRIDFWESYFRRSHTGTVLRSLSLCVKGGQPMHVALTMLADNYPSRRIRKRLGRAVTLLQVGEPWRKCLRRAGIIGSSESALLESAERAGNLDWAMEQIADGSDRRFLYRLSMFIQILGPLLVIAVAIPLALYVVAMFMPLIALIQDLGVDS